jgi:hypothetical protein
MHLRNALVRLSTIVLISHIAAANVLAQDAGDDGGALGEAGIVGGLDASTPSIDAGHTEDAGNTGARPDAGDARDAGKITYPGRGDANADLIDTYTDDHKSGCSVVGHGHDTSGWLASLTFAGLLVARNGRRRQRRPARAPLA